MKHRRVSLSGTGGNLGPDDTVKVGFTGQRPKSYKNQTEIPGRAGILVS